MDSNSTLECNLSPSCSSVHLPAHVAGKTGEDCLRLGSCHLLADQPGAPGSWLHASLALAVVTIWRMNQRMQNLLMSHLPNQYIFKSKMIHILNQWNLFQINSFSVT